jgi:hypothetical protein
VAFGNKIYHAIICKLIRQTQCPGVTLFLVEINTGTWPLQVGGVSKKEIIKYAHEYP